MLVRSRAFALTGAACVVAALAVAGCGANGSSSSSDIVVSGSTLHIYMSEPPGISGDPVARDIIDAEELAFLKHTEVKDYTLDLIPLTEAKPSDNARTAIQDTDAIAYLGELGPGISDQTVGITNAVDLLQISPTDTALELSDVTSAVKGSPQNYFESWSVYGRTFARLVPTSGQEATVQAAEMKSLGVTSVYVGHDGSDYGRAMALAVAAAAKAAGLQVSSSMSGAAGIFYASDDPGEAAKFFNNAASSDPNAKLFGPSSLNDGRFTSALSSSVKNLYVTVPGFLPRDLGAGGKRFISAFESSYHHKPNIEAIFGYEAMAQLLSVLEQAGTSADDRNTVTKDFLKSSESSSVLGSYKINDAGNTSLDAWVIARPEHGTLVAVKRAPSGS